MSRVAYVEGQYLPHHLAAVHIEDPGYQFADGAYEVMAVVGGFLLDEGPHLTRLARSLADVRIPSLMSNTALHIVMPEFVRRDNVRDGIVYVQITRGVAARPFLPEVCEAGARGDFASEERCRSARCR